MFRTIKPTAWWASLGWFLCKNSTDGTHSAQFTRGSQAGAQLGSALPTLSEQLLNPEAKVLLPQHGSAKFLLVTQHKHIETSLGKKSLVSSPWKDKLK